MHEETEPLIECQRMTFDIAREVLWVRLLRARMSDMLEVEELGQQLYRLLDDSPSRLVIDFARVEFLSSAAFGKLISLNSRVKTRGGQLLFCNIRPEVLQVFHTCHLDRVFNIRKDDADALAYFL